MLALLIAVLTTLLFSASPPNSWATKRGAGEDSISAGRHDIPIISRQAEPLDHSPRSDHKDPVRTQLDTIELAQRSAFAAWPLPAPMGVCRSWQVCSWRARGPPTAA